MKVETTSMWSPLKNKAYAVLFVATVISNIGTWMHEVGASWKMTQMTHDPTMVALIQTAVSLPIFFFALPAGAIADLFNRKLLLLTINTIALLLAVALALLMQFEKVTPYVLLLCTFLLGVCAAFIAPAWQAIVPGLVPKKALSAAVSLNGVGINISRAIGPALAGALIVSFGIQSPFWINCLSFMVIILALYWWKPNDQPQTGLPKEHILPAMISGLNYAKHSAPLKATLVRAAAFFIAASAFWSLLPIIVSKGLNAQASTFGIATGLVGVGALFGALLLPILKARFHPSKLLFIASVTDALLFTIMAMTFNVWVLFIVCFAFGSMWIIALANLNVSAQTSLPNWVRARGLAIFLTVFFGAMSIGSILWGNIASFISLQMTLYIASAVLVLGSLITVKFKLNLGSERDLEPALYWPTPTTDETFLDNDIAQDLAPVLITIEYSVEEKNWRSFINAIQLLGEARKRNGAYQWGVMQDTAEPSQFTEYFFEHSWLQHLHHHERTSGDDKKHQQYVNEFHCGDLPPKVKHLVGLKRGITHVNA